MYPDYILFAISAVLIVIALALLVYLFRSRKKSIDYHRILSETTQKTNFMTALQFTQAPTGSAKATEVVTEYTTELLTQAPGSSSPSRVGGGLDLTPLEGKYILLEEIHGGGMSRIFKARHAQLGNEWIIKYVDGRHPALENETHVLKQLNHINLPQIIDICPSFTGTFLVERYIEGYPLSQVISSDEHISQGLICDWAEQLAQVLNYLHNLDTPIIHCDLKPSNIMVSYDNKLVLIDFGISKRQGITGQAAGITYAYAAPEQFKKKISAAGETALTARFGTLPPEHLAWETDARTDLYSLGVILYELATGHIPLAESFDSLYQYVLPQFGDIINKCLAVEPEDRFQSATELLHEIEKLKTAHLGMARSLTLRRVAVAVLMVAVIGAGSTTAAAAYVNRRETMSLLSMDPNAVVVTAQQTAQLIIQKTLDGTEPQNLDPAKIRWSYPDENIARIDGSRIVGLNVGKTTIYGQYRNKIITVNVAVVEPIKEKVEISLRYSGVSQVSIFAGSGLRELASGSYREMSFVSPESLAVRQDGAIIVSDGGNIRLLKDNVAATITLEPSYITADMIRCKRDLVYFLTGPWEDGETSHYGIVELSEAGVRFIYDTQAAYSVIRDMEFAPDGALWFIQENLGTGVATLNRLEPDSQVCSFVLTLPESTSDMAFAQDGSLYLAVPEEGIILRLGQGDKATSYFAGVRGERGFIDGNIVYLYEPLCLQVYGDLLYVLDYNVIRCIHIDGEGARSSETVAGFPTTESVEQVASGNGVDVVFPANRTAEFVIADGGLLLSDPKQSVIYYIGEDQS